MLAVRSVLAHIFSQLHCSLWINTLAFCSYKPVLWAGSDNGSFSVGYRCRRLSPHAWRKAADQVYSPMGRTCVALWAEQPGSRPWQGPGPAPHVLFKGSASVLTPELSRDFPQSPRGYLEATRKKLKVRVNEVVKVCFDGLWKTESLPSAKQSVFPSAFVSWLEGFPWNWVGPKYELSRGGLGMAGLENGAVSASFLSLRFGWFSHDSVVTKAIMSTLLPTRYLLSL